MKITKASLAILTLAFSGTTKTLWGVESSGEKDKGSHKKSDVFSGILTKQPSVAMNSSTIKALESGYKIISSDIFNSMKNFVCNKTDKESSRKRLVEKSGLFIRWFFSYAVCQLLSQNSSFNFFLEGETGGEVDKNNIVDMLLEHEGSEKWISETEDLTRLTKMIDLIEHSNNKNDAKDILDKILYSRKPNLVSLFLILIMVPKNDLLLDRFLSPDLSDRYINQCQNIQTPLIRLCKKIVNNNDWWKTKNMDQSELKIKSNLINKFNINHAHSKKDENSAPERDKTLSWVLLLQHFIKHKSTNIDPQEFPQQFQPFIDITKRETEHLNDIFVIMTMIGLVISGKAISLNSAEFFYSACEKITSRFNPIYTKDTSHYGSMTHDVFIRHKILNKALYADKYIL